MCTSNGTIVFRADVSFRVGQALVANYTTKTHTDTSLIHTAVRRLFGQALPNATMNTEGAHARVSTTPNNLQRRKENKKTKTTREDIIKTNLCVCFLFHDVVVRDSFLVLRGNACGPGSRAARRSIHARLSIKIRFYKVCQHPLNSEASIYNLETPCFSN